MPVCHTTMSVTRIGPFTSGPTSSPSATSSHQRGSAPRRRSRSAATASSIAAISSSVYGRISVASFFPRLVASSRSARIISRYCPDSTGPPAAANTSPNHSCTARPANSPCLSCTPTRALRRVTRVPGSQRVPPLPERPRVEGVHPAERVALHQRLGVALESGDLVLADERVAPDQVGRRDRAAPAGLRAVARVAPQRVVVAVGLGHVAERVLVRDEVVRWLGVGAGDADALAQLRHPFVGDPVRHAATNLAHRRTGRHARGR